MKAIGFFREPAPGVKGEGLAGQNKAFLEFCERHGYDVAATFVETAGSDGRGGFRQLVDYLRRPEKGFLLVVARSLEGLGTDVKEAERRYFQLEGLGAQVAFADGSPDPMGQLVRARPIRSPGAERATGQRSPTPVWVLRSPRLWCYARA